MEALSLSVAWRFTTLIAAILLPVSLTSCGKKGPEDEKKTAQKSEDDFLDKDAKPDERKYLPRGKAVLHCHRQPEICGRLYAAFQLRQGTDVFQPVYAF